MLRRLGIYGIWVVWSVLLVGCGSMRPMTLADDKPLAASLYYTEALRLSQVGGEPREIEKLLRQALVADSLHAPSYYELAAIYRHEPAKALELSQKALAIDSSNNWFRKQVGELQILADRYDGAIETYTQLQRAEPNNPEHYLRLGVLYWEQKQPFKAIAVLDSAELRVGDVHELSTLKRDLLLEVKLYEKALNEIREIAELFPYDESNFVTLAEVYATMGRDSLALQTYQQAQALNPESTPVLLSMNEYFQGVGDVANFLKTSRQIIDKEELPLEGKLAFMEELLADTGFYGDNYHAIGEIISSLLLAHPSVEEVQQLYTNHLIFGGNASEAIRIFKSNLSDSIDSDRRRQAFYEVIEGEAYLQRYDSVVKYAALALESFPDETSFYLQQGNALFYYMENYAAAEEVLLQALAHAPKKDRELQGMILCILGDNAQADLRFEDAIGYYKRSIKANDQNATPLNNYAYLLSELNRELPTAARLSSKANELNPRNPIFLDTEAWILYRMGEYEAARELMKQVIMLEPNAEGEIFLHYGDILAALGEKNMAILYWRKALQAGYDAAVIEERLNQK